jgi:Flp pilus assembly protein TadD
LGLLRAEMAAEARRVPIPGMSLKEMVQQKLVAAAKAPYGYFVALQGQHFPTTKEYLLTEPGVLLRYVRLWLLPTNQVFDPFVRPVTNILDPRFLVPAAALAAFVGTVFAGAARYPLVAFGVLWFFVTISVESSVMPIADFMFEHRMLLPSVGLTLAALIPVASLPARRWRAGAVFVAVVALMLGTATIARNRVWQNPVAFWTDNVNKAPRKLRGWLNLSDAYVKADRLDLAEDALLRANAVFDRSPEVHYNLGVVRVRRGALTSAERSLRRAIRFRPLYFEARYNLATLLAQTGRPAAAEGGFRWLIRTKGPYTPEAYYNLGVLHLQAGKAAMAAKELEAALVDRPDLLEARHNLAVAYHRLGREAEARQQEAIVRRLRSTGKGE